MRKHVKAAELNDDFEPSDKMLTLITMHDGRFEVAFEISLRLPEPSSSCHRYPGNGVATVAEGVRAVVVDPVGNTLNLRLIL